MSSSLDRVLENEEEEQPEDSSEPAFEISYPNLDAEINESNAYLQRIVSLLGNVRQNVHSSTIFR